MMLAKYLSFYFINQYNKINVPHKRDKTIHNILAEGSLPRSKLVHTPNLERFLIKILEKT
jgi:hypothetical protein